MTTKILHIPLNRVEGDLEVLVEIRDSVIVNARCSGVMYRGFEKMLIGRGSLDGLVMTPRICGICSTAHLTSAALALDRIAGVSPPPDAVRIRHIALMTEMIQSDIRHGFLTFAADFVNPAFKSCPLYDEALQRYEPLKGRTVIDSLKETRRLIGIIAIIGGQWPHSTYMVPGGIASIPSVADILQCRLLLKQFRNWYERRILGCGIEEWSEIRSIEALNQWVDEQEAHRESEIGFYIRYARAIGLDRMGKGYGQFISFGGFELPEGTQVQAPRNSGSLIPAGFVKGVRIEEFDQEKIAEHVACSWCADYEGGVHPFSGETRPYATGQESEKYSWAKAPRYNGLPAETGPLAEMMVSEVPLFIELVGKHGPNVFVRELARLARPAVLIPAAEQWLSEVMPEGDFYKPPDEIIDGKGFGLIEVSRGSLGHWVRIHRGVIEHYQIITPTAWNASPKDSNGVRGPIEESLMGTPVNDPANPVEVGLIVRSFDACLVCTVH